MESVEKEYQELLTAYEEYRQQSEEDIQEAQEDLARAVNNLQSYMHTEALSAILSRNYDALKRISKKEERLERAAAKCMEKVQKATTKCTLDIQVVSAWVIKALVLKKYLEEHSSNPQYREYEEQLQELQGNFDIHILKRKPGQMPKGRAIEVGKKGNKHGQY